MRRLPRLGWLRRLARLGWLRRLARLGWLRRLRRLGWLRRLPRLRRLRKLRGLRGLLGSVPRLRVLSRTKSAVVTVVGSLPHPVPEMPRAHRDAAAPGGDG